MLQPPQNLKATYSSGVINISWNTAPTSDTPTLVYINLSNKYGVSVQVPAPPAAISYTVPATAVSKFTGTTVTISVNYAIPSANEHTVAIANVAVPGTPPPPVPSSGPPTDLAVAFNPSLHSAQLQWTNHGLSAGNNYHKVRVQWGRSSDSVLAQLVPDLAGSSTQAGPLGPIYPNTDYVFKVAGGNAAGLANDNFTSFSILDARSPDGSPPFVGWLKSWFQIHPEAPLQAAPPRALLPHPRYVTALWGTGSRSNHLDLFLAGGIPTLGEVWWDSWQADTAWVPWATASNAVWSQNVSVALASEVAAVWRPFGDPHLDLFAIANNGTVWSTWWEQNAGWQTWFTIFPNIKMVHGASITAVWRPNSSHLDLFVSGEAGAMGTVWSTWWEPNKFWQPWFTVSNAVWIPGVSLKPGAQITALWHGENHLDLFATAGDGSVWSTWWDSNSGWQSWFAIPNHAPVAAPGSPIAALWSSASILELFTTAADGHVITAHWQQQSGWSGWSSLDPSVKLTPAAAVTATSTPNQAQLQIFGTDTSGHVSSNTRDLFNPASFWQGWQAIRPGPTLSQGATVAAVWRPSASPPHLDLFVRGADASVWSIWWEPTYYS